jgi:hypothetical protein
MPQELESEPDGIKLDNNKNDGAIGRPFPSVSRRSPNRNAHSNVSNMCNSQTTLHRHHFSNQYANDGKSRNDTSSQQYSSLVDGNIISRNNATEWIRSLEHTRRPSNLGLQSHWNTTRRTETTGSDVTRLQEQLKYVQNQLMSIQN